MQLLLLTPTSHFHVTRSASQLWNCLFYTNSAAAGHPGEANVTFFETALDLPLDTAVTQKILQCVVF